jgi:hypothetical protein
MKKVKLFEDFLTEAEESKQVQTLRKKFEGQKGLRTLIGLYKFYFENGHKEYTPEDLLTRCEYYDQLIRKDDNIWDLLNQSGIGPVKVDQMNLKLIAPFIAKVKPGTEEFSKVWVIVQHADSQPAVQKKFMELHGETMKKENPKSYAMMADRIAINSGEQQTTLSQGMQVTYKGKTGWLPWQMKGIKTEGEPVKAKGEDDSEVFLVKWASSENSKIVDAIKTQIGADNVEKAKAAGLTINLSTFVEQVMGTDFVGNYMIKK